MAEEKKPKEEDLETPPGADKEDLEIHKEIEKEKGESLEKKPGKEEEPGKEEKEAEKVEREEKPKRTPRLMPVFTHKIEKRKWEKEKKEYEEAISELNAKLKVKPEADKEKLIKETAEKHGVEPELIKDIIKIIGPSQVAIPDSLKKDIEVLKKSKEDVDWAKEDKGFEDDFEENVLPILEKEEVPKDKVKTLKGILKTQAFTQKYAPYDLTDVFYALRRKGEFDEVLGEPKGKKSAEDTKGVGVRGTELKKAVKDMSDEEFDKWDEGLEKKAKEENLTVRRGGREMIV